MFKILWKGQKVVYVCFDLVWFPFLPCQITCFLHWLWYVWLQLCASDPACCPSRNAIPRVCFHIMVFFSYNKTGSSLSSMFRFLSRCYASVTHRTVKWVSDLVGFPELFWGAASILLKGKQKQLVGEGVPSLHQAGFLSGKPHRWRDWAQYKALRLRVENPPPNCVYLWLEWCKLPGRLGWQGESESRALVMVLR